MSMSQSPRFGAWTRAGNCLEPPSTAKTSRSKPAAGRSAEVSSSNKGLEPFLYANVGWGRPPCIDFPTAEMRRERQKWEQEKKSG